MSAIVEAVKELVSQRETLRKALALISARAASRVEANDTLFKNRSLLVEIHNITLKALSGDFDDQMLSPPAEQVEGSAQEIAEKMAALCDLSRRVQESWDLATGDPRREDFTSHLGQLVDFLDEIGAPKGLIRKAAPPPSPAGVRINPRGVGTDPKSSAGVPDPKASAPLCSCAECEDLPESERYNFGKPKPAPARRWAVLDYTGQRLPSDVVSQTLNIAALPTVTDFTTYNKPTAEKLARLICGTVVEVDESGCEVKT